MKLKSICPKYHQNYCITNLKLKKQTPPFAQNKMKNKYPQLVVEWKKIYRAIHADVIVYIFAHLHTTLRTEENLLDVYWLQATKELVKVKTWLKF